ncbi:MAG: hemolysin III family protein [Afipia sp.]|nr:hemolysin III family protein [Afipia sp.]OJW64725.1 MAG: DNA-binding protein [Afipia sp. 64-13]
MAVFRLKQVQAAPVALRGDVIRWEYDRAELIADGVIHVLGIAFSVIAASVLITLAAIYASPAQIVSVSIYAAGLTAMLGISATYNLWPVSPVKWLLRRFDHSAIYVLIAATYTPFLAQMQDRVVAVALLIGVWSVAAIGIALKVLLPGRFDRLSIALYLALGWSGVVAYESVMSSLPSTTLWLIAAGGVLYSAGVIFHAWRRLRFQNAIWHSFVLLAAACHYSAVVDLVLISA